jgi:hypothetical protein
MLGAGALGLLVLPCVLLIADKAFPGVAGPLVGGTMTGVMPFGRGPAMDSAIAVTLDSGPTVMFPAAFFQRRGMEPVMGARVLLRASTSRVFHRAGYSLERFDATGVSAR